MARMIKRHKCKNRDFASLRFCEFGGQLSGNILVETIIYKVMVMNGHFGVTLGHIVSHVITRGHPIEFNKDTLWGKSKTGGGTL